MKKLLRVLGRLFLALLFLAAAALVTLGLLRWRGLILLPDEADPDEWEVFGVDVSSYQGEVDWPVLAEQGVDFAFIKATEGSLLQDRRFAANWAGAAAAGVRAGAYHFLSYDSPGETQADNFIAAVPVTEGALPPVVDIEFYGEYLDTPPEKERVRAILDPLLERLEAHYGVKLYRWGRLRGLSHLVLQPHGVPAGARMGLLAVLPLRRAGGLLRDPAAH